MPDDGPSDGDDSLKNQEVQPIVSSPIAPESCSCAAPDLRRRDRERRGAHYGRWLRPEVNSTIVPSGSVTWTLPAATRTAKPRDFSSLAVRRILAT